MAAAFWNKIKKGKKEKEEDVKKIQASKERKENDIKEKVDKKKTNKLDGKKGKKKSVKRVFVDKKSSDLVERVIIQPVISENALNKQALNQYVFLVAVDSNKKMVKEAVKAMYGVEVEKVRMIKYKPQRKSFRLVQGKTKSYKKAIVKIEAGKTIEFFK